MERLERHVAVLGAMEKFGGASGGMNAHVVAYRAVPRRGLARGGRRLRGVARAAAAAVHHAD